MNEFIEKNKPIFIVFIIAFLIGTGIAYITLESASDGVNKSLTKYALFCEDKYGVVDYSYDCDKSGQCTKRYLNCDYLKAITTENEGHIGKYNYQEMNKIYNERFSNETMIPQ